MKRTLKFGAIVFCAMLWLNPLGAQQQSRPMPANGGAAVMKDKAVLEMQRMNDVHKAMSNVELAKNAVLPVQASQNLSKSEASPYIYGKDLSVERQLEMVEAYMRNALAVASEAGNGAEATHVFVAGNSSVQSMIKATYVGDEKKELIPCDFPYRAGGATLYPLWGTWNGHAYEGIWVYRGESGLGLGGYFTYDPFTNEARQLISAYQTGNTDNMQSDACAYDYAANKVYTLTNQYNDDYSAITGIAFHSAGKGTAVFAPAFSITYPADAPSTNIPVSMAIDKTGKMYIFCTDGKVYTVKQVGETYSLEEAGDTRQPTDAYSQSAAWDYRSDKVYWANVNLEGENPAVYLSVWDPANGTGSTKVDNFLQVTGLASVYYVDNNARPVADFGLTYGNGKVSAVFTVPALTLNDEAIASLAEIEIVKVTADGLNPVWTKPNPVPGERIEQELENVGTNGETVTLAIRVKDNNGKYSRYATASVLLFEVRLPYVNGFETDAADPMAAIVVVDPEGAGGMERTTAEKHEGEYSFKMSGVYAGQDQRQLKLAGMPVGKNGGYTVSFWAKASVADALVYAFDGAEFEVLVQVGTEWTEIKLPYVATATGQMSLILQGYGGISKDVNTVYYIDDIKVEETASPNVPDKLTINSISASSGNALSAVMNITLPSLSVSEAPLASVAGIVVHYADAASFETYEIDTVVANTVGATADFTVKVERAGQYYFRAYAYNEFGPCPEYSTYAGLSPWIGPKNMPVSMAVAAVNEDGHVKVEWADPAIANEISWTKGDTMARRLTIDGKMAFKYAQAFDAADLASYGMATPKALQIGFVPGSRNAAYTLVLAYGGTEEIYRKDVDAADLKEGEWYYTTVDETVMIDVTKSLWVIVEVAESEDQGYACAVSATTVAEGKSNKMWYNGNWNTITNLFNKGTGSVLVSLKAEDRNTVMAPDKGYKVYRGKMDAAFQDYESLATVETGNSYVDQTWRDLTFGRYKYAVVAVWNEADATPVMTNVLNKDMEFTVRFKITSNAGSAEGAEVYVVDTAGTVNYEAVANAQGEVMIAKKVWRGVYDYEVLLPYHSGVLKRISLTQDTLINVPLQEIVLAPELTAEVQGKDVVVNYGVNLHNWEEDVEAYADFAISGLDPWILSKGVTKYTLKGYTWPNSDKAQSWIVMNPSKTQKALPAEPLSGDKYFLCMGGEANDDYLVRPISKGGGSFTLFVRVLSASDPESFEVVYSSTTADFDEFKTLPQGQFSGFKSTAWARGIFSVPDDAKYVGLHCTSKEAMGLMVDDLSYVTEDFANPTGYELYLDGVKVKDAKVDELSYAFKDLSFGEHKVGVKAIYASGASELVENTVKIATEAKPIDLVAEVQGSAAVLTWSMPDGFTAKSYQVFLGNEKVAENLTEKSYTFTDLQNGKYTAAVTAVYETGVSEQATVEFLIAGVGIDDVLTQPQGFIYPNPCNGTFYLNAEKAGFAEVYSLTGKKIQHVVIPEAGTYAFNLQSAHGMYVVKFVSGGKTSLFKVVVR